MLFDDFFNFAFHSFIQLLLPALFNLSVHLGGKCLHETHLYLLLEVCQELWVQNIGRRFPLVQIGHGEPLHGRIVRVIGRCEIVFQFDAHFWGFDARLLFRGEGSTIGIYLF